MRSARPQRAKAGEGIEHPLVGLLRPASRQPFRWVEHQGRELVP